MSQGTIDHDGGAVGMTLFGTALFSQRSIPAWLVLVAGLLLTALLSMGLAEQRARSADQQFELHVKELVAERLCSQVVEVTGKGARGPGHRS